MSKILTDRATLKILTGKILPRDKAKTAPTDKRCGAAGFPTDKRCGTTVNRRYAAGCRAAKRRRANDRSAATSLPQPLCAASREKFFDRRYLREKPAYRKRLRHFVRHDGRKLFLSRQNGRGDYFAGFVYLRHIDATDLECGRADRGTAVYFCPGNRQRYLRFLLPFSVRRKIYEEDRRIRKTEIFAGAGLSGSVNGRRLAFNATDCFRAPRLAACAGAFYRRMPLIKEVKNLFSACAEEIHRQAPFIKEVKSPF